MSVCMRACVCVYCDRVYMYACIRERKRERERGERERAYTWRKLYVVSSNKSSSSVSIMLNLRSLKGWGGEREEKKLTKCRRWPTGGRGGGIDEGMYREEGLLSLIYIAGLPTQKTKKPCHGNQPHHHSNRYTLYIHTAKPHQLGT